MPDLGIAAADVQPLAGLLAANPDTPYDRALIKSAQTPTVASSPPGKSVATTDGRGRDAPLSTASGPSGLAHEIATAQGPLTPELGRRSGIPAEYVPIINWIAKGEAKGYNELYNGQHFSDMSDHPSNLGWKGDYGPDGRHTSSAGLLQWQVGTFNEARSAYNASHPDDQVHDFSDVSQNKVGAFWIDKTYRENTGGRNIVQDLYAGKTDLIIPALKGQWTSLGKGQDGDQDRYGFSNPEWGRALAEESRANTAAELATIEKDKAALIAAINKEAPGTAKRMQMLEEAHEASKRSTALYEKQMSTPPIYQPTDVFAGWGGVVMALAALAGRKSAQPLTAALNGMAGAMEGMNSGNREQYDRAFKVWEKQTDYGLKLVDIQNQEIRSILEDQRLSDAEKQANLTNTYRLFEMDREAAAARRGDLQLAWQHLDSSEHLRLEGARLKNDILRLKAEQDKEPPTAQYIKSLNDEWQAAHPGETMPESVRQEHIRRAQAEAPSGSQAGRMPPETLERMAQQYVLTGDKSVLTGLGYGNAGAANRADLQDAITRVMKESGVPPEEMGVRIAEFQGIMAGERTLGTRTANIGMAVSSAQKMLPLVKKASEQTPRTDYPALNDWLLGAEKQLGDTGPVTLRVALNSFLNAYSRAVAPTGVPTDDVRKHAYELLEIAFNKGQFVASLDQMALEMNAEQQAPGEVRSEFRRALLGRVQKDYPGTSTGEATPKAGGDTGDAGGTALKDTVSFKGQLFSRQPAGSIAVPEHLKNEPDGKVIGEDTPGSAHYVKEGGKLILLVPAGQ